MAKKVLLATYAAAHARRTPEGIALLEQNTGEVVTWKRLDTAADAFAARLLAAGFRKGDVLATSLPLLKEHVFLLRYHGLFAPHSKARRRIVPASPWITNTG